MRRVLAWRPGFAAVVRALSQTLMTARCDILRGVLVVALVACGTSFAQVRELVGATFEGRVVSVIDGDTVDVVPAGERRAIRVRLDGVDAPERGEPFGDAATRSARVLLFDQVARVEGRDVDAYGRLVARVLVRGRDASVELVRAGLACHYTRSASDAVLARAEAEARQAGRGFWMPGASRPRCAAATATPLRQSGRDTSAAVFHGNTSSRVYHAPWCRNYNCRNCTRVFRSEAEARAAGFRPAGDCLRR